jgi:hypothetical protein
VEKLHVTFPGDCPKPIALEDVRENSARPLLSVRTGLLRIATFIPPEAGHDATMFTLGCAVPLLLLSVIVTAALVLPEKLV